MLGFELNSEQRNQNIKILQEIEEQKRRAQLQQQQQQQAQSQQIPTQSIQPSQQLNTIQSRSTTPTPLIQPPPTPQQQQQQQLNYLNTNPFGYYVQTDSLYGNIIIPALPRI